MKYAVMLGSDSYIGTTGILTVADKGKKKEFFRIREIYRARSFGSYLAVDCDIKAADGVREVKLFKSKLVAADPHIKVSRLDQSIEVRRNDGSIIIRVEQIDPAEVSLPPGSPGATVLKSMDAILRITGNFYAGSHHLIITKNQLQVGGLTMAGNLKIGGGGLSLSENGFSF